MANHTCRILQNIVRGNAQFALLILSGVGAAIVAVAIAAFRLTTGVQAYTMLHYETARDSLRAAMRRREFSGD